MSDQPLKSYINGRWVTPISAAETFEAINPATEERAALVALCGPDDVDAAVMAARAAWPGYSALSLEARIAMA